MVQYALRILQTQDIYSLDTLVKVSPNEEFLQWQSKH